MTEGAARHDDRGMRDLTSYMPTADPGRQGGGTYTSQATEPTITDYENVFGPSARDIKTDLQRYKRHGRWHLPDALKGPNPWLTDRIDGLITDATNSPFTTKILPYKYLANPDGKLKWNVWSFDEGMASRVPYESAARTLTQSKRSFAGYVVRQGLAIVLEHNFMMSEKGRENFRNQLQQLIGSIQYTNDLDVHMALVLAPSYQKTIRERYFVEDRTPTQVCREFVDLFGFVQKNQNALDILIEEAKAQLKAWGGPQPDFLLCNSKLTFQLTMTPEKTSYLTQGIDGVKRLRAGPDISSYRGLSIVHSRAFSMEPGTPPRDILRRRVRVAEYYRIPPSSKNADRHFQFYNEERDTWETFSFKELLDMASYTPSQEGSNPLYSNNHEHIEKAKNALGSKGAIQPAGLPAGPRLADRMEIQRAPALGAGFLSEDQSVQSLLGKVAAAALDSTFNNWEPGGDFVHEAYLFAPGAVSWNKFFVKARKALPAAPKDPAVIAAGRPLKTYHDLAVAAAGDHFAVGDPIYIPPEKYYFRTIDEKLPNAELADYQADENGLPYGFSEHAVFRNAIKNSNNKAIHEIGDLAGRPYERTTVNNIFPVAPVGGGVGTQIDAYQEQCKITAAILFEAICDYPRKIDEFRVDAANNHIRSELDPVFKHKSFEDPDFAHSVRFRNWMRYGVSPALLQKKFTDGGVLNEDFNYPTEIFKQKQRSALVQMTIKGKTYPTTFIPWNKVSPGSNIVENYSRSQIQHPTHYSAFDEIRGAVTHSYFTSVAGDLDLTTPWKSTTIFREPSDNGVAFLREPGAFLSPNHFHPSNEGHSYKSIGSFLGANVILTREMVSRLLRNNTTHAGVKPGGFLEGTFLFSVLQRPQRLSSKSLVLLVDILKKVWESATSKSVNPYKLNLHNSTGVAGPGPEPEQQDLRRISLTNLLIVCGFYEWVKSSAHDLGLNQEHPDINHVWTWPYVDTSGGEMMCKDVDDFRLRKQSAADPVVSEALDGTEFGSSFPAFQVGNQAVTRWANYLETAMKDRTTTPTAQKEQIFDHVWPFSRILSKPQETTFGTVQHEALAFLFQLYVRIICDQSEPPYIHAGTPQYDRIFSTTGLASNPLRVAKVNAPYYSGRPGGIFNGRLDTIEPMAADRSLPRPEYHDDGPPGGGGGGYGPKGLRRANLAAEHMELVIVRPNIEHNMLGIIMGQGGEGLGNTLWGQTELSCYDDSMHGIWGMSYKYHERAIVFNEKNLVRLWDVAYDGYCGGKDCTAVEWKKAEKLSEWRAKTVEQDRNYTGPSMIVMAFAHSPSDRNYEDTSCFKRNWPSPIVFHDSHNYHPDAVNVSGDFTLTADRENLHVLNFKDMRVFNNPLYSAYEHYRRMMPDFTSLHAIRKPAGAAAAENQSFYDSLAFQGTMNVLEDGRIVESIQGSGHHGPDYVGVASIRSGKGYKINTQPGLQRLV